MSDGIMKSLEDVLKLHISQNPGSIEIKYDRNGNILSFSQSASYEENYKELKRKQAAELVEKYGPNFLFFKDPVEEIS